MEISISISDLNMKHFALESNNTKLEINRFSKFTSKITDSLAKPTSRSKLKN